MEAKYDCEQSPIMAKRKAKATLIGTRPKRISRNRHVVKEDTPPGHMDGTPEFSDNDNCRDEVQDRSHENVQGNIQSESNAYPQDTLQNSLQENVQDVQNSLQEVQDVQDNVQDVQDVQDVQENNEGSVQENVPDNDSEYERNRENFRSALAAMDQDISNCITLSERISQIVSEMGNDHEVDVGINQQFLSC